MRASLIISSVVGSALAIATPAFAEDTFEAAAASAQRIKRVDDLVWAFTAKCDQGDDTLQRQCRRVRDARLAELRNATFLIDGDRQSFTIGAWSAAKKSAAMTVSSCIRCGGVDVDGKTWFVAGTREANQPPRFQAGKQVAPILSETTKTFADDASAKKYAQSLATSKIQFVVRVPQNPMWTDSNKQGIAFEVIAYRVYSPCDGSIVMSNPMKAGPGEVDKRACAGIPADNVVVDELTPAMIKASLASALDTAKSTCQQKFQGTGSGKLKLTIDGDGSISVSRLEGQLANTETGTCIEDAVKTAKLPRSKKPKTSIAVPIQLN